MEGEEQVLGEFLRGAEVSKGQQRNAPFPKRSDASYQSADHKDFFKMQGWILGLSHLQCYDQVTNMLDSLPGENRGNSQMQKNWAVAPSPGCASASIGRFKCSHQDILSLPHTHTQENQTQPDCSPWPRPKKYFETPQGELAAMSFTPELPPQTLSLGREATL